MLPSTAQMCTCASVRPGISVAPLQSIVVTGPGNAPAFPCGRTSLIRSSSTTTAAASIGSAPVQSTRNAFVNTVILIASPSPVMRSLHHRLRVVEPHLLVYARRPLDVVRDAVKIMLLPEEDPRRLVTDQLLELRVRD